MEACYLCLVACGYYPSSCKHAVLGLHWYSPRAAIWVCSHWYYLSVVWIFWERASSLFIRNSISVGASGALFGLLGAMLSELITNWTIYTYKAAALFTLLVIVAINLAIGILPHVDNFAHIGGFLVGFLLGFVLLPRPRYGWLERQNLPASKMKIGVLILLSWAASVNRCRMRHRDGVALSLLNIYQLWFTDPLPGSPCCNAMISLRLIAESGDNRRSVCRCFMGLIAAYNPLGTAVATLPGLCGINLGFVVYPNTDCTS
ncbi:hypothetical protein GH714_027156 [Hevea brasiliensis]|uniref:RHOMBOID-like protein n=1 Tax=Hevea brasiliensis TaxID=3981 RepID=A0A6A6N803_HEVBR|nr:hypothetical protein GH714_027156 [Hevea brasiliensis]